MMIITGGLCERQGEKNRSKFPFSPICGCFDSFTAAGHGQGFGMVSSSQANVLARQGLRHDAPV
eukprot:1247945-Amphidinium_carterae.1